MSVAVAVVATVVSGVLAGDLVRQWRQRRRLPALVWAASLWLFALACAATTVGFALAWSTVTYRVFWFAGALVTVPLLAVGQLLLLAPRLRALWLLLAAVAVLAGAWAVVASPVSRAALLEADAGGVVPIGAEVWGDAPATALLAPFNWTGLVVVVGCAWSAWRRRRPGLLLIGVGVVVAGGGFSFVRAGAPVAFVTALAAGVTCMWLGVRAAERSSAAPRPLDAAVGLAGHRRSRG